MDAKLFFTKIGMINIGILLISLFSCSCKKESNTAKIAPSTATIGIDSSVFYGATLPTGPVLSAINSVFDSPAPKTTLQVIDVTKYGIKPNDNADDSKIFKSLVKSNVNLFFPKGTYDINQFVNVSAVQNFSITGEAGTIFKSTQDKILTLSGNLAIVEISRISFVSTKVSNVNDPEGLVFISCYGDNDLISNINIHDCQFTNPKSQCNGIKLVSEGKKSLIENITIANNKFVSIGRMGVEFQNHLYSPILARYKNYYINNNSFVDIGTIQTGPAPSCISVSGYSVNGQINNNDIKDMHMNTSGNVYYGIENAGAVGLTTNGNHIHTSTYGFTGILGSGPSTVESISRGGMLKGNWTIQNNLIELTGSVTDKTKIRGIDISYTNGFTIANNVITTDGLGMKFTECQNGNVISNTVKVKNGNVLYFQVSSSNNSVYKNILDASSGPDDGVVMFNGPTTKNNNAYNNKLIKTGGKPGAYVNWAGALNNYH